MTLQTLLNTYFQHLEFDGNRPLHTILQDRLQRLIDNLPDRSVFPSERSLSEALNVHRNTLHKALEPFLARGLLVRFKHQTLVRHGQKAASGSLLDATGLHPLQLQALATGKPKPVARRIITLRLYENLPRQRQFWQETIAAFQQKHPGSIIDAQITTCENFADYREHLLKDTPDLFMLPVPLVSFQAGFKDLLAPLPDDLIGTPEVLTEIYAQAPHLLKFCCPLSFAVWHHQVNLDLVRKYRFDLTGFSQGGNPESIIRAAQSLPPELKLAVHFDALVTALGLPNPLTADNVRQHALRLFRVLVELPRQDLASRFLFPMTDHFNWYLPDVLQCFMDGRLFCHTGMLPALLTQHPHQRRFPVKSFLLFPQDASCNLNVGAVTIGISRRSTHQDTCIGFLRHLLSDGEQERMSRLTGNLPFNRRVAVNSDMLQGYDASPREIISRYRITSSDVLNTYWSGKLGHTLWYRSLLAGACAPEEAADQFTEAFIQAFPAQMTDNP